jgi:hypothetical protein
MMLSASRITGLLVVMTLPILFAINMLVFPAVDREYTYLAEDPSNVDAFIRQWDLDGDGVIDRKELRQATGSDYIVGRLFSSADKNHDGKLDRNEFRILGFEKLSLLIGSGKKRIS